MLWSSQNEQKQNIQMFEEGARTAKNKKNLGTQQNNLSI